LSSTRRSVARAAVSIKTCAREQERFLDQAAHRVHITYDPFARRTIRHHFDAQAKPREIGAQVVCDGAEHHRAIADERGNAILHAIDRRDQRAHFARPFRTQHQRFKAGADLLHRTRKARQRPHLACHRKDGEERYQHTEESRDQTDWKAEQAYGQTIDEVHRQITAVGEANDGAHVSSRQPLEKTGCRVRDGTTLRQADTHEPLVEPRRFQRTRQNPVRAREFDIIIEVGWRVRFNRGRHSAVFNSPERERAILAVQAINQFGQGNDRADGRRAARCHPAVALCVIGYGSSELHADERNGHDQHDAAD
jgi:hypothetical protein